MSSTTNTWAEIAKQPVAAQKLFGQTECTVSFDKYIPKVKTPPPAGKYPVFYDLSVTEAPHEEIATVLPPGILGVVWRPDLKVLEVDVQTEEEQGKLLSTPLPLPNHPPLPPLPSAANTPRFVLVKLANVPIASAITLETLL